MAGIYSGRHDTRHPDSYRPIATRHPRAPSRGFFGNGGGRRLHGQITRRMRDPEPLRRTPSCHREPTPPAGDQKRDCSSGTATTRLGATEFHSDKSPPPGLASGFLWAAHTEWGQLWGQLVIEIAIKPYPMRISGDDSIDSLSANKAFNDSQRRPET